MPTSAFALIFLAFLGSAAFPVSAALPVSAAGAGGTPADEGVEGTDRRAPAPPDLRTLKPTEGIGGTVVTITGENLPRKLDEVSILVGETDVGPPQRIDPDGKSLVFVVPHNESLTPGRMLIRLVHRRPSASPVTFAFAPAAGGYFQLISDAGDALQLTGAIPAVGFLDGGGYRLTLVGQGFSPRGPDNQLLLDGQEQPVCWFGEPKADHPCLLGTVSARGSEITLSGFLPSISGAHEVRVRVAGVLSAPVRTTFAMVGKGSPRRLAIVVTLLLGALLLAITWRQGRSMERRVAGKVYGILTLFFLDTETDTYSLSRLQFFVWTTTVVFSYVYLTVSRILVQGHFEFPDLPTNLPGILAISVGTSVAAAKITTSHGPKGAGAIRPSVTDFLTSGGVIALDRFQFLVWTLVSLGTFLVLVLSHDPADISTLPSVPWTFLVLMGLSSLGYLGGKIARPPGPVIDGVTRSNATMVITGRGLSPRATIAMDGKDVVASVAAGGSESNADEAPPAGSRDRLVLSGDDVARAMAPSEPAQPTPAATGDEARTLRLTNPDGQHADYRLDDIRSDPPKPPREPGA